MVSNISNTIVRDRDYIKDTNGNYLRVVGDYHPMQGVVSFVKYYPSDRGKRVIDGKSFGYNTFVANSLLIMKNQFSRIMYSPYHGDVVTVTPQHMIKEHYSCREKTMEILNKKDIYEKSVVGSQLITFLTNISKILSLHDVGITGSFLFDAYNDNSDIDLVCYGKDAYKTLFDYFKQYDFIQCYEDGLQEELYIRRMTHMPSIDVKTLIKQESRKVQGRITGTNIHINCQPLREDVDDIFNQNITAIGDIECVAKIIDDSEGMYSPAIYNIEVISITSGAIEGEMKRDITCLISYVGDYSQVFRNGDIIFVSGKLIRIERGGAIYFGIETTSWNYSKRNKAILLR